MNSIIYKTKINKSDDAWSSYSRQRLSCCRRGRLNHTTNDAELRTPHKKSYPDMKKSEWEQVINHNLNLSLF